MIKKGKSQSVKEFDQLCTAESWVTVTDKELFLPR
jgi:hypothetical protein